MSTKTKTSKISIAAQQAGLYLMAAAATFGMLELPDHLNARIAVPNQPAFAFADNSLESAPGQNENVLRRERDESAPHYISYSEVQRTAARSGKL